MKLLGIYRKMKPNPELANELEKYLDYVIIVEGKNDIASLKELGFKKIYCIHKPGVSLKERIEKICTLIIREDKVCILTDLDKKGKYFHAQIKQALQEKGIKVDSFLRKLLAKEGISHIEGLDKFMEKVKKKDRRKFVKILKTKIKLN